MEDPEKENAREKQMTDSLGYWPGQDNTCDEVEGCKGAGTAKHIEHVLARLPLVRLMGAILSHCGSDGGRLSRHLSCTCCVYAEEIGRRATFEGQKRHEKAVADYRAYWARKYPTVR